MGDTTEQAETTGDEEPRREPPPDLLERAVSWISATFVLALAGFLVWEGLQQKSPPTILTQAGTPWKGNGAYYLPIDVKNTGDLSVQNLRIQVRLSEGQQIIEEAEAGVSWVPAHSSRRVVVAFHRQPRKYDVQIRPEGYEHP